MKKKLFLVIAIVAVLACLFAIGVSAAEPDTSKESVTLGDGTVCQLWDTDGNPLIWYVKSTAEDGTKTYDYVDATSSAVTYSGGYSATTGGVKWYQLSSVTVTVDGTAYDKSAFVVLNLQSENVKITSGQNVGQHVNCLSKTFTGSKTLEYVYLPLDTVDLNGENFKNCTALKYVNLAELTELREIGSQDFNLGNVKQFMAGQTLDLSNTKITAIAANGFACCSATEIILPSTLASVGNDAFKNCSSATKITFNSTLTSINTSNLFSGCTSLETVTGLSNVFSQLTEISGSMFHSCSKLNQVDGLIENGACVLPEGVTTIGNLAFYKSGITSLHIPASVESLGYQVAELTPITSLTFAENSNLTFIGHRAFRDCDSLVGPVILPYGLIEMNYGVFDNCEKLKAVKMPDTLTTLSGNAALFNSCPSLEYVQFSKNLTGTIFKSMFENCYALKAISFPDSITKIDYKALRNCTSLEAVYLPSGLEELGSVNTSASDWGVFFQSPKVYLVNEPFNVFDGDKLVENFVMPQKPEVYYMPSGMTALGNSAFQNCSNLNKYIVFPTGITSVGECSQGAFFKASSSTNPVTFVFLGNMTSIRIRQNDNASSNMSFIFANPNDTGITSMEFIIGSANNAYMTNTYAYFCASNTVYDLSTFKAKNSTVHTVTEEDYTKTVNTAETQPHFHSPRDNKFCEATCTDAAGDYQYCFCGAVYGFEQKGADALGHLYNDLRDQFYPENNYYANATCVYFCSQCNSEVTEKNAEGTKLFTAYGYSASEDDPSNVAFIVYANAENIKAYSEFKAISVAYGLVVSANTNGTPLTYADGSLTESANTVKINMTGTDYNKLTVRVSNIGTFALHCNGYIVVGEELFYLNHATVDTTAQTITYAEMLELLEEAEGGTEEEIPEETPAE